MVSKQQRPLWFRAALVPYFIGNWPQKSWEAHPLVYKYPDGLITPSWWVVCRLMVLWKRRENWEQPLLHTDTHTAYGNCQGTHEINRGAVRLHTKIVKISIFTGHMGTFCESYMRVGHWQGVDLVPCDSPFHSKEPNSNAASFSQHLYDLFRAFRNFTWSIYTYCLFDAVKYVTIEAIDMKYEKGPVRSLKSMASSTCSSFALTIQLWGI